MLVCKTSSLHSRKAQYLIPKDCKRTDFAGMDCSTPSKNQGKATQARSATCEIYSRSGFSNEAWQLNDSGQNGQVWVRPTHTCTHTQGRRRASNQYKFPHMTDRAEPGAHGSHGTAALCPLYISLGPALMDTWADSPHFVDGNISV